MIKVLTVGQLPKEVGGSYTTGVARVVYELCKKSVSGVEQFVYATNVKNDDAKNIKIGECKYFGYRMLIGRAMLNILSHPFKTTSEWKHYKNVCHQNPLRFEIYKANFQKVIEEVQPDIIHIHGDGIAPLHFAIGKKRIPVLRTYHGLVFKGDTQTTKYKKVRDDSIGNKDFADYNTALTEENKKEVAKLGISEDKIDIIPNGNDSAAYFYSPEERKNVRSEQYVGEDTIVFMTTGVVIDRKGQYSFLQVLKDLPLNYQYWIVGKGPDEEKIKTFIAEHQLEGKVKLLGYIDMQNMYRYLSAADVFAHVSYSEGQSLAEIEAYSTGLRVIVNKVIAGTVIGDAYNDHQNYYVVNFENPDKDSFIKWLESDTPERKSRTNFDWQNIAELYKAEYLKVIERNR